MKILDCFASKSNLQVAIDRFHSAWHVATRTIVRTGPHSVSWVICADVNGDGGIPSSRVAGGVCDNRQQADDAMARHFELWTLSGPTAMRVLGRAGW